MDSVYFRYGRRSSDRTVPAPSVAAGSAASGTGTSWPSGAGVVSPPAAQREPYGLRERGDHQQRGQHGEPADREHRPPAQARHQQRADRRRDRQPADPDRGGTGDHRSAMPRRHELGDVRQHDRDLRAQPDALERTCRQQPSVARSEGRDQREHAEHQDRGGQRELAAEPVRQRAGGRGADEHPGEQQRAERAGLPAAQPELVHDAGQDHAGHVDDEAIEEMAGERDQVDAQMPAGEARVIHPPEQTGGVVRGLLLFGHVRCHLLAAGPFTPRWRSPLWA